MTHKSPIQLSKRKTKLKKPQVVVKDSPPPLAAQDVTNRVIEVIASSSFDPKKIAVALAKTNPELFLKLVQQTSVVVQWHRDVVGSTYRGEYIPAIKFLREKTGLGLKEAKNVIDNLRLHMSNNGYMLNAGNYVPGKLTEVNQSIFQELAVSATNML